MSRNTISGLGGDGILIDPVFGPTVLNNDVFNVGGSGIEVASATGNVTINNNTVDATGAHGIYVHDTTGTIGNAISIFQNGNFDTPYPATQPTATDDRCIVVKLFGVTNTGGVVVVDVRKADILRDHPSRTSTGGED